MNITLTVVVAAIVILITALVVLTIFGSGMTNVGSIAQAESLCQTQCEAACRSTANMPVTWNVPTMRKDDDMISCGSLYASASCIENECALGTTITDRPLIA